MNRTKACMQDLINRRFYNTIEEVKEKLDGFFMFGRFTVEECAELEILARQIYEPTPPEQPSDIGTGAEPETPADPEVV